MRTSSRKSLFIPGLVSLLLAAGACGGASQRPALCSESDSCTELSFQEETGPIANPERGYFVVTEIGDEGDLGWAQDLERTLVNFRIVLDDFRDRPIDQARLDQMVTGFAQLRDAGIKCIIRFQYNEGSGTDAPLEQVLQHIGQLGPILHDNSDVIAVLQAGLIGAWGEWHSSSNNLDEEQARDAILRALLAELPKDRMVQVRSPTYKDTIFPGGPVTAEIAYKGDDRARVGHHNDCFLASESDKGTYEDPIEEWRSYVSNDSRYTPVGGEACKQTALSSCSNALAELATMHWSYANHGYPSDVIQEWQDQGCYDEIDARLGYRFVLDRASWTRTPSAGNDMHLKFEIKNKGFAAPYNKRPVFLVLRSDSNRYEFELSDFDPRMWMGGETQSLTTKVKLSGVEAGSYELSLWFPDPDDRLRAKSAFSIRMANRSIWQPTEGLNILSPAIEIAP